MLYKLFERNAHIGVVLALLILVQCVPSASSGQAPSASTPAESKASAVGYASPAKSEAERDVFHRASAAGCTDFEPAIFFSDDFQDGQAEGWSFSDAAGQPLPSPWPVENDEGNLVLSGSDHTWATLAQERNWADFRFRTRVKLLSGAVHLNYRVSGCIRYFIGFTDWGLYLNKTSPCGVHPELTSVSDPHNYGQWYTVEIVGNGGNIQIYVDGVLKIDYTDSDPVLAGSIAFETLDDSHVHFDDVSVSGQVCTELRWSQTGMLPGGGIVSLEVAPTDPDVVFFTTNVNDLGMWRSADAGASWSRVFQGTHGLGVAIHPTDPQTALLLGGHGSIHKTTDGGTSWEEVFEDESKEITDLAYAPSAPNVVYAGTWGGEILKSTDGGDNWSIAATGLVPIAVLSVSPTNPDVVYAGTNNGISRSTDGGTTWIDQGLPGRWIISLAGHPTNGDVLYAASDGGLYKTTDGGATWTLTGLAGQDVHRVAVAPSDPQIVYAGGHNGVSRSTDGGATWTAVNTGLGYLDVGGLAVSPADPNTVYAGTAWWQWIVYHWHTYDQPFYGEGIYKTTDGGQHWVKLDGDFADDDALAVIVDPNDASTVYVGTACSRGGFRSTDGGLTWGLLPGGPEDAWDLTHYSMAMAVGTTGARPLYWTGSFGVARSLDRGLTWQNLYRRRHFHGLAVDPTDSDVIYVGTVPRDDPTEPPWMEGAHIFKSVNGGTTWTEMDSGFPHGTETAVHAIVIDPSNPQILYVATTTHEARVAYGVYKSTNRGGSWAAINNGLTVTDVMSLAINPVTPTTLYAGTANGVFKTVNRGSSWTPVGLNGLTVEALAIDPNDSESVYAGTSGGVYKTRDGGGTWYAVNWGLPGKVTGLAIDPQGDWIYAAVPNGGVYRAALKLLFSDEFDGNELDLAQWDVIRGIPTVGDGELTLPGGTTRAEIQSKSQFQYGVLQAAIESSDWVSQTQGTDSSFGFEIWTGANGQCHYGAILIANGHLGVLRPLPDANNNCSGDPLYQAYLPISNWDAVRAAGRVYLTLTWSPGGVTLYVSDGSSNSGLASYTGEAEPAIPLEIRLNADLGEVYRVDYIRYQDLAALFYNPGRFPVYRPDLDWDRDVDVTDIMIAADAWRAERGEPQYRQYYDLYHDGKINVVDIMRVASHWDETFDLGPHFPLAYSPYRPGQAPGGPAPSPPEISEDMGIIGQETKLIRTYGACDEELAAIPGIADGHGIHVYQGVNLTSTPPSNDQEMACFAALVAQHENIVAGVIGNETLLSGSLGEPDLTGYLNQARETGNVPVTTGEPWGVWCNEPQAEPPCQGRTGLAGVVDFILAHSYPYWENVPIEHAAAHVVATYLTLRALYPDRVVIIGETGWPTCGGARDNAVPSLENQQRFIEELWRWSNLYQMPVLYFEAFDEDWKIAEPGGVGPCWGLYYADRTPKHDDLDWSIPAPEPAPTEPAVRIDHPRDTTTTVTKSNCGIPVFGRAYNAEPGWHVKVEVYTNEWYIQDKWYPAGLAPIIDGMWSMPEVFLGGQDGFNNHSIRATLVDETGVEVVSDEIAGIARTNPCSP